MVRLNIYSGDNRVATALACSSWGNPPGKGVQQRSTTFDEGATMNLQSHIDVLKGRHASLESRIADEDRRPRPDDGALSRMKLEKLRLKEEMERLNTHQ